MNCKNCQTELEEGVTLCPNCGTENAEPVTEAPVVEETPAKTGLGAGKIALLVVLAVAAIAVIAALILGGKGGTNPAETTTPITQAVTGESTPAVPGESVPQETVPMTIPADGNPDDVTCKGSYTADAEHFNGDTIVATLGDAKLTNTELQSYYWMQVYDFLNQYAMYAGAMGLDYTKPFEMQASLEPGKTWQQFFLDSALSNWANYQAMCHEANANGYVLEQMYQDYLDELPASMAATADEMGYESAEDMVRKDMGPGATVEGYVKYMSAYYLGYMYYGNALENMPITDEEVESYFDAHAEEYMAKGLEKTDDRYVDVRHILIMPQGGTTGEDGKTIYSDAEWAAAEAEANAVLNEWLTKGNTEENFAALAQTRSQDPGSASNGGLYEDVYKGQMVPEFENWCFEAERKTGDYGIVRTTYGYHVMYYVGGDYVWFLTAEQDMMAEKGNEFLAQIQEKYSAEIDYSAIQIGAVDLAAAG